LEATACLLTTTVSPEYATQTVKWESSDTKIVTVSSKGVLCNGVGFAGLHVEYFNEYVIQ